MKFTIKETTKNQWHQLQNKWHPIKNNINLEETTKGSHTLFWWKCPNGHEWRARISTVLRNHSGGCPFCRGLMVNESNCLASTHPKLALEWYSENKLLPTQITAGCNKKVHWKCEKGHKWLASILSRKQGNNCPYCSKRIIDLTNCLSTTHPELANQWHQTKNKIFPNEISAGSGIKVWWKCPVAEDHEWKTSPNKRTGGRGCPCCSGQKTVESNCLSTTHPNIAAQWHPTKNGNIKPNEVTAGSQKKYWWTCSVSASHEWLTTINNRKKTGCPFCSASKGEKIIINILTNMNITFEKQKRFKGCCDKRSLPFDFYIQYNDEYKLIEYQGIQHYVPIFGSNPTAVLNGTKRRDKIKKNWCKKHGIKLLTIPYWKLNYAIKLIEDFIVL